MAIKKKEYKDEKEIDSWLINNVLQIFGDVIFIPGDFFIKTKRNKGGKPDGFIIDLGNQTWTIIEAELLKHGVWDHIAEQIIRFIVASKNDDTLKCIRNKFFDKIESENKILSISNKFSINPNRLFQYIENILFNNTPEVAIFIDDINEDFEDMIEALNAIVKVYKIQKYEVNGVIEYLPPENMKTTLETTFEDVEDGRGNIAEAINILGGGSLIPNIGSLKLYKLNNNDIVSFKYSKHYEADDSYWFGITPRALEKYENNKLTHLVFLVGTAGLIKVPYKILKEYLNEANASLYPDKSIKHFHVFIKRDPMQLFTSKGKKSYPLETYFHDFE